MENTQVEITILTKNQLAQLALEWTEGREIEYNDILTLAGIELKEDSPQYIWDEMSEIRKIVKEEGTKLINPNGIKFNRGLVARGSLVHVLFDHDSKKNGVYEVKYIVRNSDYSDIVVTTQRNEDIDIDFSFHIDYVQKIVKMGRGGTRLHERQWQDKPEHRANEARHSNEMRSYVGMGFSTHTYTSYGYQEYVRQWLLRQSDRLNGTAIDGQALMDAFGQQNWIKETATGDEIYHPSAVISFPKKKANEWLKKNLFRFRWTAKQEAQAKKEHDEAMAKMYEEEMEFDFRREQSISEAEEDAQVSVFDSWDYDMD